jgi:hypothetical protein
MLPSNAPGAPPPGNPHQFLRATILPNPETASCRIPRPPEGDGSWLACPYMLDSAQTCVEPSVERRPVNCAVWVGGPESPQSAALLFSVPPSAAPPHGGARGRELRGGNYPDTGGNLMNALSQLTEAVSKVRNRRRPAACHTADRQPPDTSLRPCSPRCEIGRFQRR